MSEKVITDNSMSRAQFLAMMSRIQKDHRFGRGGQNIKYVRPSFDMRNGKCFHITFDEIAVFDFRDNENSMFQNISEWLTEKEGEE